MRWRQKPLDALTSPHNLAQDIEPHDSRCARTFQEWMNEWLNKWCVLRTPGGRRELFGSSLEAVGKQRLGGLKVSWTVVEWQTNEPPEWQKQGWVGKNLPGWGHWTESCVVRTSVFCLPESSCPLHPPLPDERVPVEWHYIKDNRVWWILKCLRLSINSKIWNNF